MNTNEPARDLAGGSVDSIIDAHIAQTLNYLKARPPRLRAKPMAGRQQILRLAYY